jgi:hypothetical protein
MPFWFARTLQLSAISARLLSLFFVIISGDMEKLSFLLLRADPGVFNVEPLEDAPERRLRGV